MLFPAPAGGDSMPVLLLPSLDLSEVTRPGLDLCSPLGPGLNEPLLVLTVFLVVVVEGLGVWSQKQSLNSWFPSRL